MATLDERCRRQFAGLLAFQKGRGGIQAVHWITGLSRNTIRRGRGEMGRLRSKSKRGQRREVRIRHVGGGRKALEKSVQTSWMH